MSAPEKPVSLSMRHCDHCQKEFTQVTKTQRFCADTCRAAYHRNNQSPLGVGNEFSLHMQNPKPFFKTKRDGDHYFVMVEITKQAWDHFTSPGINRQGMVIESTCRVSHMEAQETLPQSVRTRTSDK